MSGVVIVPERCADEVVNAAEEIMRRDSAVAAEFGWTVVGEVMGARYERARCWIAKTRSARRRYGSSVGFEKSPCSALNV